jgi:hypothetical protein
LPILIQWKWEEKSKSFLVIFYFYDNFSKPNLRFAERNLSHFKDLPEAQFFNLSSENEIQSEGKSKPIKTQLMTWAPSHRELALLSDLLHYANMINGLPETIRRDLRFDLEVFVDSGNNTFQIDEDVIEKLDSRLTKPNFMLGRERNKDGNMETVCCHQLSSEYLDYLREITKPCL